MRNCFHLHTSQQQPAFNGKVQKGRSRKQEKQKVVILHLDWRLSFPLIPAFIRVIFSQTQETLKKSWKRWTQSPTTSYRYVGNMLKEKNPQQFKSHHGSDVSVLSLLAGGSRQTLQKRQTNTMSFKEEKVMCSRTELLVVNNNRNNNQKKKNPQAFKHVTVKLINNVETMSMWCYVRQNTLILTQPQSVNTQLVRGDTLYN